MRMVQLGRIRPALAVGLSLVMSACGDHARLSGATSTGPLLGQAPIQAHPQAIEPQAGVVAPSSGPGSAGTPQGDPTAHARTLAEVRRELKILNLCGGATSPAFAQPVV